MGWYIHIIKRAPESIKEVKKNNCLIAYSVGLSLTLPAYAKSLQGLKTLDRNVKLKHF